MRDKGIATQTELLAALMPYMEWVKYQDLLERFWAIVDGHYTDGPVRSLLHGMHKKGYIDKRYGEVPQAVNDKIKLTGYLYVRRIVRKIPKSRDRHLFLNGTHGDAKAKERAKKRRDEMLKIKKPVVASKVAKLTWDDVRYIQSNPHNLTKTAMGETMKITRSAVRDIQAGKVPAHLKGRPVQ